MVQVCSWKNTIAGLLISIHSAKLVVKRTDENLYMFWIGEWRIGGEYSKYVGYATGNEQSHIFIGIFHEEIYKSITYIAGYSQMCHYSVTCIWASLTTRTQSKDCYIVQTQTLNTRSYLRPRIKTSLCSHCFHLDPYLEKLLLKPDNNIPIWTILGTIVQKVLFWCWIS